MKKEEKLYTISEACEMTNLSYDTLKFYCNQGLVPNVKRDKNNYRMFDNYNIAWINSLSCLKSCGMNIKEMKEYLDLCLEGKSSIKKRKKMLDCKLKELIIKKESIDNSIDFIHTKNQFYDDVLSGKREYYSNLVPKKNDE